MSWTLIFFYILEFLPNIYTQFLACFECLGPVSVDDFFLGVYLHSTVLSVLFLTGLESGICVWVSICESVRVPVSLCLDVYRVHVSLCVSVYLCVCLWSEHILFVCMSLCVFVCIRQWVGDISLGIRHENVEYSEMSWSFSICLCGELKCHSSPNRLPSPVRHAKQCSARYHFLSTKKGNISQWDKSQWIRWQYSTMVLTENALEN